FDLLLFGRAVELQGYALLALERMARRGLGAGRARFALERMDAVGDAGETRPLYEDGRPIPGAAAEPRLPVLDGLPDGPLALRFTTPLRLRARHEFLKSPTFRDLTFAMVRRLLELAHLHLPGALLDWDFRPWLERAAAVRIVGEDLRWHDWERYSHRQRTRMKLGGLLGTLTVAGDLAPFAPLLRTVEVIHVGKSATFGLGKLELAAAQDSAETT
ncbi:MAG: CRISPR system precrRNA processing endoribonuclease RAMP protein Cas6, partial [Thermoanaerobaculia bacterium]